MTSHDLAGTWMHPTGVRVEVCREDGQLRTYTYMSRRGARPQAAHDFDTEDQIRDAIAKLEQQGYIRQVEDEPEPAVPQTEISGWVLIGAGVVFLILVIVVLVS